MTGKKSNKGIAGSRPLLEAGLVLVTVTAPVFFGAVYEWSMMPLCAVVFALLFFHPEAVYKVRQLPRLLPYGILAVIALILLQALWLGENRVGIRNECIQWLALGTVFLLIQLLNRTALRRLGWVLIVLAVLESLYGLSQLMTEEGKILWRTKEFHLGHVTGTYFNRNHMAGFLEVSLGLQLGFLMAAFQEKRIIKMLTLLVFLGITIVGWLQTGSRMGIMSFCLAAFFLSFFLHKISWTVRGAFWFLLVTAFGGALLLGQGIFTDRFEDVDITLRTFDGGRFLAWQDTLRMIGDHPWWGIGLGNFRWFFPAYQSEHLIMGWDHAHNDYLELLATLGIPAFAILITCLFSLWFLSLRRLQHVSGSLFPLAWGGMLGVTSLAIHGLADFNGAIFANALTGMTAWAMVWRWGRLSEKRKRPGTHESASSRVSLGTDHQNAPSRNENPAVRLQFFKGQAGKGS